MATVESTCEECEGRRFQAAVLEYTFGGRNIAEVLEMSVAQAEEFFADGDRPGRLPDGFIPTDDGAFVANEPQGSPSWYAVNDMPDGQGEVPHLDHRPGRVGGDLERLAPRGQQNDGTKTWRWMMGRPISTYLVTATIGRFDLTFGETPVRTAVHVRGRPARSRRRPQRT